MISISICGDKFKQIFRNHQTKRKKSYHKRPNPPLHTFRSQQFNIPFRPNKKNPPLRFLHPESQGQIHIVPSQVTYPFYSSIVMGPTPYSSIPIRTTNVRMGRQTISSHVSMVRFCISVLRICALLCIYQ